MLTAAIIVQTRREYLHSWPDAPEVVGFLRHPHRHMFHVKLSLPVSHSDREKEFFIVQRWLKAVMTENFGREGTDIKSQSCEDMATTIVNLAAVKFKTNVVECEVWEDGENGARVCYSQEDEDD